MQILSMRLEGYKRLLLRNIKVFEITPDSIHQIIIGTNGSGKSSILKELSPLPAFSGDYVKGGSKTITLSHRGKLYTLSSTFNLASGKHSFVVEGLGEQNPGGTGAVQKELVYQHFALDEATFNILTGKVKFSTMPPIKRRELLIAMSECNLDYAMELWGTLKGRARDQQGVVKHLTGRIAVETDKLPAPERLAEMRSSVNQLKRELTLLMESKEPISQTEGNVRELIARKLSMVEQSALTALRTVMHSDALPAGATVESLADVQLLIDAKAQELAASRAVLDHNNNEYESVREIVEALAATNASGIDELHAKIKSLHSERALVVQGIRQFPTLSSDPDLVDARISAIYNDLVEILATLPANANRKYTREQRDRVRGQYDAIRLTREKLQRDIGRYEHRLEHIAKARQENCPKCGFIWTPGLQENEERDIHAAMSIATDNLKKLDDRIATMEVYFEELQRFTDGYRRFQRLVESNPTLHVLWDYCLEADRIMDAPANLMSVVDVYREDVSMHVLLKGYDRQIELYDEAIAKAGQAAGDGHYAEHITRLTVTIEHSTAAVIKQTAELQALKRFYSEVSTILGSSERTQALAVDLQAHVDLLTRILRRDGIVDVIDSHQSSLAQQESTLTTATTLEDIIADLSKSRGEAILDHDAFKRLVDELSPVDGLIADQLKGFIQCFVEQLNDIIAQVWTYDMVVQPCGMDSGELDYKFPVLIGDDPSPDVSETSTGQVEMFDFAFKLVVMLYMGFDDYPLYMDELGPHLDEQHRINIMHFVRTLVETKKCSQMWLISHYASMHGIFPTAEICVMDDRNITLPHVYNKHVVFQ